MSGKSEVHFTPEDLGESTATLRDCVDYDAEGVKIAEERLAQLERGEATLVTLEEVLRSLGR